MWKNIWCRGIEPEQIAVDRVTYAHADAPAHLPVVRPLQPLGVRAAVRARRRAAGGAARRRSRWPTIGWILVAMVAARSAAMGFNRLVDARIDALNPRTANRELPRGAMSLREAARLRRRRVAGVRLRGVAAEPAVLRAVAGRAGDRVLVFAGEALHDLDAAVSRPGDGGRAGRRLAGGRRPRRLGAVAARAGDRLLGRRLRRALCLPGSRVRSRARPAIDSGALRRAARRWRSRASMHVVAVACLLALACGRRRCRAFYLAGVGGGRGCCWSTSNRWCSADDLSQVKRAFDLNGYVGILYLLVLAVSHLCPLSAERARRSRSPITGASGAIYATRTLAALLDARRPRRAGRLRLRPPAAARRARRGARRSSVCCRISPAKYGAGVERGHR